MDLLGPVLPRRRRAHLVVLLVGLASIVIVLATFVVTTLVEERATAVLLVILLLSVGLDIGWKRARATQLPVGPASMGDGPGILQGGRPRAPQ